MLVPLQHCNQLGGGLRQSVGTLHLVRSAAARLLWQGGVNGCWERSWPGLRNRPGLTVPGAIETESAIFFSLQKGASAGAGPTAAAPLPLLMGKLRRLGLTP